MVKTIHQTVTFEALPHEIYEMLMDSKKHSEFTGSKCNVSKEIKGNISCYDGWIEGENVELEQDKKIVQKWRGKDWPEGHYSTVTFDIKETPNEGTELKFTQIDVPDEQVEHIKKGWRDNYWNRMKEHL